MKKFLFTLLLLLVCHIGYGQNIDSLFDEFECEQNVHYVKISPFVMFLGKISCKREEESEIIGKMKSLKVMDLGDCSASVKECFYSKVSKLNQKGYEELMRINDERKKIRILMKIKKDAIHELLFVCSGNEDCTLIQINGKFAKNDIDKLVSMETGKKNGRR